MSETMTAAEWREHHKQTKKTEPLKAKNLPAEIPMTSETAYLIYRVKVGLELEATLAVDGAWAAYEAIRVKEEGESP